MKASSKNCPSFAVGKAEKHRQKFQKYFHLNGKRAKSANFQDRFADYHLMRLTKLCEAELIKPAIAESVMQDQAIPAFQKFVTDSPKILGKMVVEFDDKAWSQSLTSTDQHSPDY